jgi:hypothetical protein
MIPRLNDFIEMASVLEETYSGMDLSNMVIEFSVSKGILQKINEELFYRNNAGNMVYGNPEPTDEININIGNIRFRCVEEKNESQE